MWNFEESPILEGYYKAKEEKVGPNESNVYHFELKNGSVTSVWGSTVIDNNLQSMPLDTFMQISYVGEVKGQRGTKYKNFTFAIWEE